MIKKTPIIFFLMLMTYCLPWQIVSAEVQLVSEIKIQEKIKSIDQIKELDDKSRTHLLKLYTNILEFLDTIKTHDQQSQAYINARKQEPEEIKALEKKLDKIDKLDQPQQENNTPEQLTKIIEKISLDELEHQLNSALANLAVEKAKNSDLTKTLSSEIENSPVIRNRIIEANQKLDQLQEEKKLESSNPSLEHKNAEKWLLDSHIEALRSEIKMLDLKLSSQPTRLNLLKLQQEWSAHDFKQHQIKVASLKQQVALKRDLEIKKTQNITREEQIEAQGKHTLIQSMAQSNSLLSNSINTISKKLSQLEISDDMVNKEIKRLSDEQIKTQKRLDIAGFNQILGQALLAQKKTLPDSKQYEKNIKEREQLIAQFGLSHLQYKEELDKLKFKKEYALQIMKDLSPEVQLQIQDDLIDLLKTRRELLEKAISTDASFLKAAINLDFSEKKLIKVVTVYSQLLEEHLLWLRSAPPVSFNTSKLIPGQLVFFLSPSKWLVFSHDFLRMFSSSLLILPALLFVLFLLLKQGKLKKLLINSGVKTKRISKDSLLHTIKAIFYTLILAIPIPLLFFFVNWDLSRTPNISEFSYSISIAMQIITLPLFLLLFALYMCLHGGLFEIHFKWSEKMIQGFKKELIRLMFTFLPALFMTVVIVIKGGYAISGGLGRALQLLTLLTFAIFFYRTLKPGTGFLSSFSESNPEGLFARFQGLWLLLCLAGVVGIMLLSIFGYVYTAAKLTLSLIYTLFFVFSLILIQQISVRWLLLTQRRYALNIAFEKRKTAQLEKQEQLEKGQIHDETDDYEDIMDFEEPEIDVVSLSEESTKLLNVVLFILGAAGLVGIWSQVLPALGVFDAIELWHRKVVVDGTEKLLAVTIIDLGFAMLLALMTFIGAKRLPAIIEILLLNTSVSSGSRYTITTLINYTIIGIGLFSVFNILGADWARFQWLFAALSVGIGFGLQEIVANFISGIIILFERPIRVGDIVSVGGSDGMVTKIRIRATTILTFDRKELLVPNKEFITGQLLNWTFSDQSSRLTLPIGVAYGSNIPRAKKILLAIADENERVLDDPAPNVVFVDFGDNTLNLHLRCYIDNIDNRMSITSALNETINEKFNAAGISIAFPQRDVHLDINHPIEISLQKNA